MTQEDQARLEKFISETIENRMLLGNFLSTFTGIALVNTCTSFMMYTGMSMIAAGGLNSCVVIVFLANAVSKMRHENKQFKLTNAALVSIIQPLIVAIAAWMSFFEWQEINSAAKTGKELFFQEVQDYYPVHRKPESNNFLTLTMTVLFLSLMIGTFLCQKKSSPSASSQVKH